MALYAMADLHLAISCPDKSMEIFGEGWKDYMRRIDQNVRDILTPEDTLLLPGDLSWAIDLNEAESDFRFIDSLPGQKLICRGNHDYYWTTVKKMEGFFQERGFDSLHVIRHNCIEVSPFLITGTRGWKVPGDEDFSREDQKVYDRELIRLSLCIDSLKKADPGHDLKWVVMLHYPPVTAVRKNTPFSELLEKENVDICLYGHLHGRAHAKVFEGIKNPANTEYKCVSADFLDFMPLRVLP